MTVINIKGAIVPNEHKWIYELLEWDAICPKDVEEALNSSDDEIKVLINSGGGSVFDGFQIYSMLCAKNNVTVEVQSICASAASVIAMAGKKVTITPVGQIMIHNCSAHGAGNHKDLSKTAEVLKGIDKSIAAAYLTKVTELDEIMLLELMDAETWMTAQDALDYGFVDEILYKKNEASAMIAASAEKLIPQHIVDELLNVRNSALARFENLKNKTY